MSKEYFNEIAANWDIIRESLFSAAIRDQAMAMAGVAAGKIAADIGAGTGFITEGLLARNISVIAVDQSEAMLAEMKAKFAGQPVTYALGDAHTIGIADQTVDYVFANMFLHHVEKPSDVIEEMVRILKPGGKLVIADMDEHKSEFLRIEQHDRWLGFRREDIACWFKETGLMNVKIDCAGQT